MENTKQSTIVQSENKWYVSGAVLVDNVTKLLLESSAFDMGEPVFEINFSKVTDVDTAAISLMLEWQRRALAANKKLIFTHLPSNLTSLTALYGVAEYLPMSESS
ncbi:MAG: STAS domain-containing protein [Methylotenera sp.]